ncbi:hypothetical protein [Bacillus solimangrovi]|uniref:hypothetical protein n=1 Tax=Bacillus solimangrovi TaxID=1305675 RepID=UPI001112EA6D|nr:hypothetical protein [Bacillus solimangrovi]
MNILIIDHGEDYFKLPIFLSLSIIVLLGCIQYLYIRFSPGGKTLFKIKAIIYTFSYGFTVLLCGFWLLLSSMMFHKELLSNLMLILLVLLVSAFILVTTVIKYKKISE